MVENINCEVLVPKDLRTGKYANAFRVIPDGNSEYFLDFVLYSKHENAAKLVSRIRVTEAVLATLREKLNSSMTELEGKRSSPRKANKQEQNPICYNAPGTKERQ